MLSASAASSTRLRLEPRSPGAVGRGEHHPQRRTLAAGRSCRGQRLQQGPAAPVWCQTPSEALQRHPSHGPGTAWGPRPDPESKGRDLSSGWVRRGGQGAKSAWACGPCASSPHHLAGATLSSGEQPRRARLCSMSCRRREPGFQHRSSRGTLQLPATASDSRPPPPALRAVRHSKPRGELMGSRTPVPATEPRGGISHRPHALGVRRDLDLQ